MMIAFADDIKAEMNALDERNQSEGNEAEFYRRFCKLIRFHSSAIQLSSQQIEGFVRSVTNNSPLNRFTNEFYDVFNLVYTFYFLWTGATICDTLLMLQMEMVE